MGEAYVDNHLKSSEWCQYNVPRIHVPEGIESMEAKENLAAAEIVDEQINWAFFMSTPGVLISIKEEHQNLVRHISKSMNSHINDYPVMAEIPVVMKTDDENNEVENGALKAWRVWDSLRMACDHKLRLLTVLRLGTEVPLEYEKDFNRWLGEPIYAIIIEDDCWTLNRAGYPCLTKSHQNFISKFVHMDPLIIIETKGMNEELHLRVSYIKNGKWPQWLRNVPDINGYRESGQSVSLMDYLQTPLQPLMDDLESLTYETFEKDPVKYDLYQQAVEKALKAKDLYETIVFMLGAGRGPIVDKILRAAKNVGKRIKVYAIEKNPSAVNILRLKNNELQMWGGNVEIISSDMRDWKPDFKADIIVSELLGSFSCNELSPECLIGANHLLKDDAISIPTWYTSYLAPMTSESLYRAVKKSAKVDRPASFTFECNYVVNMNNKLILGEEKEVFSFSHPKAFMKGGNSFDQRACLSWKLASEARVHGFAGYFHCCLYDDVFMSITPKHHSPKMFSWFPVFFPIETPMKVRAGEILTVHMWRCTRKRDAKTWYEWRVTSPDVTRTFNPAGRAQSIGSHS